MAKLGFTGLALAGCLALTSCNSTGGLRPPSAFNYPEAQPYVQCLVDHAKKRVLAKKQQLKNADLDYAIMYAIDDCEAIETKFGASARADGMSPTRVLELKIQLRTRAWDVAWDEVARIRMAQLKAEGAIR